MIAAITFENFKCFAKQRLPLRRLTVLSGVNGTGKTSAIQALLLLRQSFQQDLLPGHGLALNGDLVHLGAGRDALFEDAPAETIGLGIETDDGRRASWRFAYEPDAEVLALVPAERHPSIYESSLFGGTVVYLGAARIGPQAAFSMEERAVRELRNLGAFGENTPYFLYLHGNDPVRSGVLEHTEAPSSDLLSQTEAWIGEISPGARLSVKPFRDLDVVQLRYSFVAGTDVSNPYRPGNVGFGLTYTLPIIVAALAAPAESLLIVENPEAHLHPRGQIRIAELLARASLAGIQVLVETHSDHILNGIRLAVYKGLLDPASVQLHFFERQVEETRSYCTLTSPVMDAEARIEPWPDGFFDQWDRALEELLTPRSEEP
jgi:predicted ATPase